MIDQNILVHACLIHGNGKGSLFSLDDIQNWRPDNGLLWIHLDSNHEDAMGWLEKTFNLNPITCEALSDESTRPRSVVTDDGMMIILRAVNHNPDQDPEDMVAIRMLFGENFIITTRYRRVLVSQELKELLLTGYGPKTKGDFLTTLLERITDRMSEVILDLDDCTDEMEEDIETADPLELQTKISDIRRSAIHLRRYIAPQRDALSKLIADRIDWIPESDRTRIREVAERTARFVQDIESARDRALISQEEIKSRISNQMNKAMYILAIITAIFLPLTLLTGLLGINVSGIPGAENKWAFSAVTIGLIVIAVMIIAIFKRIKWL